ncbi:hypothetical protein LJC31_00585 [Synergistaceae bacterium OttesenSCG-928-I11]|nr:hypothetical protein [Synergistaceae bacterium OttesenSCG-928-I11]
MTIGDFRLFGINIRASALNWLGVKTILAWKLEKFAETYGIELTDVNIKETGKMLNISASIESIDTKK